MLFHARQDKFWVEGAPGGERWEIYTVLQDSPTFWGEDGAPPAVQASQCCGGAPETGEAESSSAGACCA